MPAGSHASFTVGTVTAAPGSIESGTLDILPRAGDGGTTIPFTIVHGASGGPVLALVAGVHGMEYVPILGLQRLRTAIDPASLRGPIVNQGGTHRHGERTLTLDTKTQRNRTSPRSTAGFDVLVGRDVLKRCVFQYNGSMGFFTIAY